MARRWNSAITAPSNSVPRPVSTVAGEKALHTIVSLKLVAIKRQISEPRPSLYISPYPFWRSSSSSRTMRPAMKSWMMIKRQTPVPMSLGYPYMPVRP